MKRIISVLALVAFVCCGTVLADTPAPSTFAPAKELTDQVSDYIKKLETSTATEADYNDLKANVARDADTLAVIALTLGLHDTDNKYKKAAPALIKACQLTSKTKDYAAAKAGIEAIKKAAKDQTGNPANLKWEKVASLKELMEAVPLVHTKLKKYVTPKRLKTKPDVAPGCLSVIAAIAQGAIHNAKDTEKPKEVEEWEKFCFQMRDAATKTHQSITGIKDKKKMTADEKKAVKDAMVDLQQSCDDCHGVFHKTEEK